ncbi:MAG: hypothetical protein GWP06_15415 [Actinobacteria bacterium]|nr:hypothetical protein [Actinomycetota bacterium]
MNSNFFKLVIGILFIVLAGCSADKRSGTLTGGKEIVLRLEPGPDNPRNSEGDFIHLQDGRILFIYSHFTGGSGDNAEAHLSGRFSDDGGRTWSKKDVTILANEGGMNIMSVSLLRLQDGRIALFYLRKNSETDCIPFMRISTDEAKTWSAPKKCIDIPGYYVMNNDRAVQLHNGRIILPVSLHNTPEINRFFNGRIMCYFSDDNGQTWSKSAEAANPDSVITQEPGVVQLKSGKLMLFCRTDAGVQYISFSQDKGEHWSLLQPSNIISPVSPASIERIPSTGDLLLVWNKNSIQSGGNGNRTPFNLAVSKDEGKTWEKTKTIESDPNGWYCYTAIDFVDDHVLLGHCAGDRSKNVGLATTQITRLSLDWIYAEATSDPFVKSDSAGIAQLACRDKGAQIRYTLDRSLPSLSSGLVYQKPISVSRTTPLLMQAFAKGKTPSGIVSTYIGANVYQKAQKIYTKPGPGLFYYYYEGEISRTKEIEKLPFIETGIVPEISLDKRHRDTFFAFVFKGYIKIPQDGKYTFYLESNDGSVLFIDDSEIINNDGPHGDYEKRAAASLRRGNHKMVIKYFQMGGRNSLKFFWKGPGFSKVQVPADVLFHTSQKE